MHAGAVPDDPKWKKGAIIAAAGAGLLFFVGLIVPTILAFLSLGALVLMIVGLVNPRHVVFWIRPSKRTRPHALIYIGVFFVVALVVGALSPVKNDKDEKQKKTAASDKLADDTGSMNAPSAMAGDPSREASVMPAPSTRPASSPMPEPPAARIPAMRIAPEMTARPVPAPAAMTPAPDPAPTHPNIVVRVQVFPDADGDAFDKGSKPDIALKITVNGVEHQTSEASNRTAIEMRPKLHVPDGAKITIEVQDRDPKGAKEVVGTATLVMHSKRPIWATAGWAELQLFRPDAAPRVPFSSFMKKTLSRHRKARLAAWGKTVVRRGSRIRFDSSDVKIAKASTAGAYRWTQVQGYCDVAVQRVPNAYFVMIAASQRNRSNTLKGSTPTDFFGGVKERLIDAATGTKMRRNVIAESCLWRERLSRGGPIGGKLENVLKHYYQVRTGQWWKTKRVYVIPSSASKRGLYLQLTGKASGKRIKRRVRLF